MNPTRLAPLLIIGLVSVSCSESNDVVFTADEVVVFDDEAIAPPTTAAVDTTSALLIQRVWSPQDGVAELLGVGADGDELVTVDDQPADVQSFEIEADDAFTLRVRIADEGAHTVCIGDECGRVFVVVPSGSDGGT